MLKKMILVLVLCSWGAQVVAEETRLDDRLQQLAAQIRNGDAATARDELQEITTANPGSSRAWALRASAEHATGDYRAAAESNLRAASDPALAAGARYNEACARSLLGEIDAAKFALDRALDAGFVDYDLMASDPDLDALRARYPLDLPPEQPYVEFTGENGVRMAYRVILPQDHVAGQDYPTVVFFPPGRGSRSADWALENWIAPADAAWIVVVAVGPERGWFTHPSHHALEDMLDALKAELRPAGGLFHVAGLAEGARVAATYSQMSGRYFASLTTYSATHWSRWEADELARGFRDFPLTAVVGEGDATAVRSTELLEELVPTARIRRVEGADQRLLPLFGGGFVQYLPADGRVGDSH